MKTDLYTKIILTIIAVALTINLFKGTITPAMADNRRYISVPLNTDGTIDVRIKDVDQYAFKNIYPIPVKSN
jgi:hypothetical protein